MYVGRIKSTQPFHRGVIPLYQRDTVCGANYFSAYTIFRAARRLSVQKSSLRLLYPLQVYTDPIARLYQLYTKHMSTTGAGRWKAVPTPPPLHPRQGVAGGWDGEWALRGRFWCCAELFRRQGQGTDVGGQAADGEEVEAVAMAFAQRTAEQGFTLALHHALASGAVGVEPIDGQGGVGE